MKKTLTTIGCIAFSGLIFAQTISHNLVNINSPVDTNTIAFPYVRLVHAVQIAEGVSLLDTASLNKAIQIGADLVLIDADTNGWVVAVSNLVAVRDVQIYGTLLLSNRIWLRPGNDDGRTIIDGAPLWYNRYIPGVSSLVGGAKAGLGEIVTDPYLDWRLRDFYTEWSATNRALWAFVANINNLPESFADDLQTYTQITNIPPQMVKIRDEINSTNQVIRRVIADALEQAGEAIGNAWTGADNEDGDISLADHQICVSTYGGSSLYLRFPIWTGLPYHSYILFSNASGWQKSAPSIDIDIDGSCSVFADEYNGPGNYWSGYGMYLFEFLRFATNPSATVENQFTYLFIRVLPIGQANLNN